MSHKSLSTRLVQSGSSHDFVKENGRKSVPEVLPVHLTSVYAFDSVADMESVFRNETDSYIYGRTSNPNTDNVQKILAAAENGEAARTFSSGMSAVVTTILSFVSAGDHIIASPVLYGAVWDFLENDLKRFQIEVSFVNFATESIEDAIRPNTKLIYTETIANPIMEVNDIPEIAKIAHRHNLRLIVDNTFASPVVANVLELGADLVVYSATKYLGGHSDIVGGAVVGKSNDIEIIERYHSLYGSVMDPVSAWLLTRSLRTLELRVTRQCQNAQKVAEFLETRKEVRRVFYPGLPSNRSYQIAKKLFHHQLFGGMISFDLKDEESAIKLIDELEYIKLVPSLAGVSTTISYPARTSHRAYSSEQLEAAGITYGTLRLSVGLEESEDIIAELESALKKL